MPKLTQKQADMLAYIKEFIKLNTYGPTRVEMAEHFEIHPNAAQDRVKALIRKGALRQDIGRMRSTIPVKGFRVFIK